MTTTPTFSKNQHKYQQQKEDEHQQLSAIAIGSTCSPTEFTHLNQSFSTCKTTDNCNQHHQDKNYSRGWILPKYSWFGYIAFYGCLLFFLIIYSNNGNNNVDNDSLNDIMNDNKMIFPTKNPKSFNMNMNILDEISTATSSNSIITPEMTALEAASFHMTHKSTCFEDKNYSTKTTKLAYELPFAALFQDTRGEKRFEASSVIKVDDSYYAVCDNSWAISKFSASLTPFSKDNIQIGNPNRETDDSGYEAIIYYNQTQSFYVIRESVKFVHDSGKNNQTHSYHAIIEELTLIDYDYNITDQCRSEFEFEGDSKGFEGAFGMPGVDGEFYIVGLCEGNYCSESKKFEAGHGQMIMMKKNTTDPNNCYWQTVKSISIPNTAHFRDYSDIEVTSSGKVAITTQEDSALWIGYLLGIEDGKIDPDKIAFDESRYELYDFPKSNECLTVYCNIEGITFINDEMIMAVSDKMKNRGKQPYWCLEKDQSIHAFVLP